MKLKHKNFRQNYLTIDQIKALHIKGSGKFYKIKPFYLANRDKTYDRLFFGSLSGTPILAISDKLRNKLRLDMDNAYLQQFIQIIRKR